MRISLNDSSTGRLLAFMQARGITNPTHGLNVLITEAALLNLIPETADKDGNDTSNHQQAA
ncbi:hypothetical protein [Pseudomonas sp. URMO17WK12:I11]|jgi:hypothetical protein|uniref:hypothetical protein n=1 Tax=Pseudomonas sp. URMO17WK12:I11 TaxID=1283291 RepID=UPI000720B7C6|nr:hypothetical protein [Pseudomonas sp. URMO17WK12:I11]CRL48354.1 hypothetical protein PSHI_14080 [Pseudomonas sp. URMO17WK12:I11]